jgi:hypothetical protein
MKLPLNREPNIRAYAHHAYPDAIMSADEYIGRKKAEIEIKSYAKYKWEKDIPKLEVKQSEELFEFYADPYETNTEMFMWHSCADTDEIEVTVHFFQFCDANAVINLFICNGPPREAASKNQGIFRMSNARKRGFYASYNEEYMPALNVFTKNKDYKIRLAKQGNKITAYYTDEQEKWNEYVRLDFTGDDINIGLNCNFGQVQYYNWLYSNYIQLMGTTEYAVVYFDYFYCSVKDHSYQYVYQLLDFKIEDYEDLLSMQLDICEYCKGKLPLGYYISVYLDEYYLPNRNAFQKRHFLHENLIFGFENDDFCLMGYGDNNVLNYQNISCSQLREAYEQDPKRHSIRLIRYNPNYETYYWDPKTTLRAISEYLSGYNSSEHYSNQLPIMENTYGQKNLYKYLETKEGQELFLRDKRISHLIYEHKVIMQKRIHFYRERGYLNQKEGEELSNDISELVETSIVCRNLMIKYQYIKEKSRLKSEIMEQLKKIIADEQKVYNKLLGALYTE